MGILTALLIASAITAVVSAGGSIAAQAMQNKSTKDTNEANKQINESNNAFSAEQASVARDFEAEQADATRVFNAEEAEKSRQFNAEQAVLNREFQAAEAQKQRDYETEMSNTAISRRAKDLMNAGFNPMLAITSGSASTPGAVAASGSQAVGGAASANNPSSAAAHAAGFLPMKAMDFSPMAAMSANLSHMVSSANSLLYLNKLAKNNPSVIASLAGTSGAMTRSITGAGKFDKLAKGLNVDKLTGEIKAKGLDAVLDKYL